ncbi:MAG: TonB-dependent receptor [Deltaproteobacteria bacterium]|jgi:vitamin B12 transporter|nr:TonB-dependent receptor [Deltaproteobacteria bacterium]
MIIRKMMPRARFRPMAFCLLAAFSVSLSVPPQVSAQSGDVLPPTVVLGRQIEEKLSTELAEYGHQVVVIQGEDIAKMGYSDLNEALAKLAPGFHVSPKSRADYSRYFMNGRSEILFLIDGVRVNNRLFGSGYMDTIGIHQVERVEILYGGESLYYGTESSSGVVNVVTKKPTQELSGQVGVSYGTKRFYDAYGSLSFGLDRHRFLVSASYDGWDGYLPFPKRAYQLANNNEPANRDYRRLNIGLKYDTDLYLAGRNNFSLSLFRSSGEFGNFSPAMYQQWNDRVEYVGIAKWDHDVTANYSYYIKAYIHTWWSDYTQENLAHAIPTDHLKWGFEDWGVNFLNSFRFDRGDEIILGLDFQSYWGKDYWYKIEPMHEKVWAVFVQYRPFFSFWEAWKVAIGARYNIADAARSFVWNLSSKMPFLEDDKLYFRVNIGTNFQLPNAEQLFVNQTPNGPFGNRDLKPQRSFAASAALVSSTSLYDIEFGGFYERVTDMFGNDASNTYQNVDGKSTIYGFTIGGAIRPLEGLSLNASYSRNYFKNVAGNGTVTKRLNFQPSAQAKLSAQYDGNIDGRDFGIGVYANWIGKTHQRLTGFTVAPPARWYTYGDYWLVDVNLYVKPTDNIRVTLSLANIFDKTNAPYGLARINDPTTTVGGFVYTAPLGPPFTATLGVSYSF